MTQQASRRCSFCQEPGGSREHALPLWLTRTMGIESEPAHPGMVSTERGLELQGNPRATGDLVTKRVCHQCNNGWMRDLENRIIPLLSPLVTIDTPTFDRASLEPLRANLSLVCRWLMKTAVTLSQVMPPGKDGTLPGDAPSWAFRNEVPKSCMLYAGWIEDARFHPTLRRGFQCLNGGRIHAYQIHEHSFNVCIQFMHLGLRFVNAPHATWALTDCRDASGRRCRPSILMPTGHFADGADDSIRFTDFGAFSQVCVVSTGRMVNDLDPE